MPETLWNKTIVPVAGDGFLTSLAALASSIRQPVPVASVAAGRLLIENAINSGVTVSAAEPVLLAIGSGTQRVLYTSDGTKSAGDAYILSPVNEVEVAEKAYTGGVFSNLAQFQWSGMAQAELATRPYDRVVIAVGFAYGNVNTGRVNLGLRIGSSADQAEARFPAASDGAGSATVTNSGIIPAGVTPEVRLGVVGDHPGMNSTIQLGTAGKLSKIVAVTFPITMA